MLRSVKGIFNRGQVYFLLSSALVQLMPLLSAPIVARLYSPAEFGTFAIFYALLSIFAGVSLLAMNNAILMETEDKNAVRLTGSTMFIGVLFCAVLALIQWVMPRAWLAGALGVEAAQLLLWFPLALLIASFYQCLYTWAVRTDAFKLLARNKIILGLGTAGLQIGIGLLKPGAIGFVMAHLCIQTLATLMLVGHFHAALRLHSPGQFVSATRGFLKQYKTFPLYTMPANLVNMLSTFTPDFILNLFFGASTLGQYSMANRLINFPLAFVSSTVQDVFRQQSASQVRDTGECRPAFLRIFALMSALSLGVLLPLILLLPFIIPVLFGPQWDLSATMIQAIGFLILLRFISSPLSFVWIVRGYQNYDLLWQIGLLVLSAASLSLPKYFFPELSVVLVLVTYSLLVGLWYAFCVFLSYRFSGLRSV